MRLTRIAAPIAGLLAAALVSAQKPGGVTSPWEGHTPEVNLRAPNGEELTNESLQGKPVVLVVLGYTMSPDFVQRQYAEALMLQRRDEEYARVLVVFTDPMDRKTTLPFGTSDEILERINGLLSTDDKPITLTSMPPVKIAVTYQWPKDGWYAGDMMLPGTPETLILDAKGGVHSMLVGWTNEQTDPETKQSSWSLYADREVHKILGDVNTLRATAERIAKMVANHPDLDPKFYVNKFLALAACDKQAAGDYARSLAKGLFKADGPGLNEFAWTMAPSTTRTINWPPNSGYRPLG